jgi:hypothetical protein
VQFSALVYSVNEPGGTALINVTLSTASVLTVTVNYATNNGTATAGSDYTPASGVLTFAPGVTSQTFPVPILDDLLDEPDETVALALSVPTNATLGAPNTAALTILDNDTAPTVQFSSGTYTVNENGGPASITVNLSTASALTVTVNYATSDGTATVGSDYTLTSGFVTFAPGVTSQTFPVPILDDLLDEPDETVALTLSAPTNATLGAPNVATLTILDNDIAPTVQFSAANYTVGEAAGTAPITVTLSAASALTVTVDYATSNGIPPNAALAGSDYLPISGTLTFLPLQTVQTFVVTIINDAGQEPPPPTPPADESFTLTLSNSVNATPGTPNPATVSITDDDTGACSGTNPPGVIDIGPPDCRWTVVSTTIFTDIIATGGLFIAGDSNPDYDLVYYEREADPGSTGFIDMDRVTVQISTDNITWYTVFWWGDGLLDTNTNIGQAGYGGAELNNTPIPMSEPPLYRSSTGPITGIAIDVDNSPVPPPPGLYRFVSITGDLQADVDSIEVLP